MRYGPAQLSTPTARCWAPTRGWRSTPSASGGASIFAPMQPRYVIALDAAGNRVVVGSAQELLRREVAADEVAYGKFDPDFLREPRPVVAQVRYKMRAQPAIARVEDGRLHVPSPTHNAPSPPVRPWYVTMATTWRAGE